MGDEAWVKLIKNVICGAWDFNTIRNTWTQMRHGRIYNTELSVIWEREGLREGSGAAVLHEGSAGGNVRAQNPEIIQTEGSRILKSPGCGFWVESSILHYYLCIASYRGRKCSGMLVNVQVFGLWSIRCRLSRNNEHFQGGKCAFLLWAQAAEMKGCLLYWWWL